MRTSPPCSSILSAISSHIWPGPRRGYWNSSISAGRVIRAGQRVPDRLEERQVLDPLSGPVRPDLGAGNAPDLLRVGLEEVAEQAVAEAVDHPMFKRLLLLVRKDLPLDIARHNPAGLDRPQICQRINRLERIIEEFATEKDPRQARARDEFIRANLVPDLSSTSSIFVKKRWPPISNRKPLLLSVREIPPTILSASSTTGRWVSLNLCSSYAPVRPAGPPPITATLVTSESDIKFPPFTPSHEIRN